MNDLIFGLEVSVIGFLITMTTLLFLALILLVFTKSFAGDQPGKEKGNKTGQKIKQEAVSVPKKQVEMGSASQGLRPEIVAAAIGALNFSLEKKASLFSFIGIQSKDAPGNAWAQAGRTRLINLRQDFALYKRGKIR